MEYEWTLRDEFLAIANRWPIPMLAFLLGGLLGLGISFLFPALYRAETNLSVAYNADAIYRNPDDYKNWQLKQLNTLAIAPDVLQEVLARLRKDDPYWTNIGAEGLGEMVEVSWQNTGLWHLDSENRDFRRASRVVQIWSEVIVEKYNTAVENAVLQVVLDKKIFAINVVSTDAKWRLSELISTKKALGDWRTSISAMGGDQSFESLERWRLMELAARAAGFDRAWDLVFESLPSPTAASRDYLAWIEQVDAGIDGAIVVLQDQIKMFEQEQAGVMEQYAAATTASRGLSANLVVKLASGSQPKIRALRPSSQYMVFGGIFGLLVWAFGWLARSSFRRKK